MEQQPSIGRDVHFVLERGKKGEHRAAKIVNVLERRVDGVVNLCVFLDGRNDGNQRTKWIENVKFDPNCAPGTWHWPERVG